MIGTVFLFYIAQYRIILHSVHGFERTLLHDVYKDEKNSGNGACNLFLL